MVCWLVLIFFLAVMGPTIVGALVATGRRPWPTRHPDSPPCPECGKPLKPFVEGCHHCGASFK